jgi:hypothetical protein
MSDIDWLSGRTHQTIAEVLLTRLDD